MRTLAALALAAVTACSSTAGGDLQAMVDSWAEANEVSAVAVSIRSPSGDFTFLGAGDPPPTGSSLFEVGSLTKTMVAATVLLLAEDGLLDLDEPIAAWLPAFPRADEITLRHLLSHTADLADGGGEEAAFSDLATFLEPTEPGALLAAAAGAVGNEPLPAPHVYANNGYWVAGAVIEAATGRSLADVMRLSLLKPLGMDDTYFAWSEQVPDPLVPGELSGPNSGSLELGTEVIPGMVTAAWAAGGAVSSSSDMAVFYGALLDELLAPGSAAAMTTTAAGSTYGLGLEQRRWGETAGWGHNGAIPGYTASAAIGEGGWTMVVLTNQLRVTPGGLLPDAEAFVGQLLAAVLP